MKTDSIFFQIFQTDPNLFFEILQEPSNLGDAYEFRSEEIKQTSFRIDGIFVPKPNAPNQIVIFAEFQFQFDPNLYNRMFAEISLYLFQNPNIPDWRGIAIFPKRSLEPQNQERHRSLLNGDQFQVLYLEDLLPLQSDQLGILLMQLIVSKPKDNKQYLDRIAIQIQQKTDAQNQDIIELVNTIMLYKFPELTREVIEAMFTVSELKQTRVYQDALAEGKAEGKAEGELIIIRRQLTRKFGKISSALELRLQGLAQAQLEQLGEDMLDFNHLSDLEIWLNQVNRNES